MRSLYQSDSKHEVPRNDHMVALDDDEDLDDDLEDEIDHWDVAKWIFKIGFFMLQLIILRHVLSVNGQVEKIMQILTTLDEGVYTGLATHTQDVLPGVPDSLSIDNRVDKAYTWFTSSAIGTSLGKVAGIPAFLGRSIAGIVLVPARFILFKIVYLVYLVGFLSALFLFLYWVMYVFVCNTLGEWAVKILPSPSKLASDISIYVASNVVKLWWQITEAIKDKVRFAYGTLRDNSQTMTPTRASIFNRRKSARGSVYNYNPQRSVKNIPRVATLYKPQAPTAWEIDSPVRAPTRPPSRLADREPMQQRNRFLDTSPVDKNTVNENLFHIRQKISSDSGRNKPLPKMATLNTSYLHRNREEEPIKETMNTRNPKRSAFQRPFR